MNRSKIVQKWSFWSAKASAVTPTKSGDNLTNSNCMLRRNPGLSIAVDHFSPLRTFLSFRSLESVLAFEEVVFFQIPGLKTLKKYQARLLLPPAISLITCLVFSSFVRFDLSFQRSRASELPVRRGSKLQRKFASTIESWRNRPKRVVI